MNEKTCDRCHGGGYDPAAQGGGRIPCIWCSGTGRRGEPYLNGKIDRPAAAVIDAATYVDRSPEALARLDALAEARREGWRAGVLEGIGADGDVFVPDPKMEGKVVLDVEDLGFMLRSVTYPRWDNDEEQATVDRVFDAYEQAKREKRAE